MRKFVSSLVAGSLLLSSVPAFAATTDADDGMAMQGMLIQNYRRAAVDGKLGRRMMRRAHTQRVQRWKAVRKECLESQGNDRVRCMTRHSRQLEAQDDE